MNPVKLIIPILLLAGVASAQLAVPIPSDNRVPITNALPWQFAGCTITNYPISVYVTNYGAVGDGSTENYLAFSNAIFSCADGGAVFVSPGVYSISNTLLIKDRKISLRGADPSTTWLKFTRASGGNPDACIAFGTDSTFGGSNSITAGGNRGSTSITLSAVTGMAAGRFVQIYSDHDTNMVFGNLPSPTDFYNFQLAFITNISGNVIQIDRPLYLDYTNAALHLSAKDRVNMTTNCGIENLTVWQTGNTTISIDWFLTANCWATNVVVTNSGQMAFSMDTSCRNLWQYCVAKNSQKNDGFFYGFQYGSQNTDCMVIDNWCDLSSSGFVVHNGCSGCVIAYNYFHRGSEQGIAVASNVHYGGLAHGGFANYNLFEGNVFPRLAADDFWGCNRAGTWLRNWAKGWMLNETNGMAPDNQFAAHVDQTNYFFNLVGNVLAYPYTNGILALALGWDESSGSMVQATDPNQATNIFLHGNFDFVSGSTGWSNGISHTLPNSYFLAAKPAWFGNRYAWPPIGPDISTTTSSGITNVYLIPAQGRYFGQNSTVLPTMFWGSK